MPNTRPDPSDARILRFDQSGALLRKVMESAAVGMSLVGADGHVIFANRAFEAMLGFAHDACLGQVAANLVFEDDRPLTMLRLDQVMRGETDEFQYECRMRHADGSPIWVLVSASLLRSDTTGRPLYAIVQVINIERQKLAEKALADSESRWNFALEAAGQGVWDHDIRRDDMFYSRQWRRMRGIPDDEYVDPAQERWLERVHPDDVPHILSRVKKQDYGEDGFDSLEYRERHRDGHYVWIMSRGRPVEWDADGTPIRTVGTDTDITRLKQTELQLAEEKERLRVTLESIGEGVISTDAEERIIFMNPIAEAMTAWAESEALGHDVRDVFVAKSEATGEPASDHVGFCLATRTPSVIEDDVVLAARDGIGREISGTATPVRAEDGNVIGAVLVFKDVTDHQEERRKLAHSANHDVLTGLPNRSAFARALAEACRQADSERRQHTLCFIDLDRFKPVNDSAGHAAGDALLKQVAQLIRSNCRSNDFAARIGGDEFVLLLADCPVAMAARIATKIVEGIGAVEFAWAGTGYRIGASIGIAPVAVGPADDILAAADAACYAAKSAGRGQVMVAGSSG